MKDRNNDIDTRLQMAAKEIIRKGGINSSKDVELYLKIAQDMPLPDFSSRSEQERANNTDNYKRARSEVRKKLGIEPKSE